MTDGKISIIDIDNANGERDQNETEETVEILVIRCADGKQCKLSISADLTSYSLNNLKDAINNDTVLGPITRSEQRIFHLGRELKTGNRSLQALGVGKFNIFVLHLHSLRPKKPNSNDSDINKNNEGAVDVATVKRCSGEGAIEGKRKQQRTEGDVVELLDSESDDDVVEVEVVPSDSRHKHRKRL